MTYTIWLTDACNMNCKYCYEKNKVIRNMNSELADKTIEFISKTNIEKNLLILLHGGEPLMNYDILIYLVKKLKEVAILKEWNIAFVMTTNGTLLDDEKIEFIVNEGIYLTISCDGIKEVHDKNRKFKDGKNTHSIVVENIIKVLEKMPNLRIRMTFRRDDVLNIYNSIKFVIDLGGRYIVPVCDFYDSTWDESTLNLLKEQLILTKLYIKDNVNIHIGLLDKKQYKVKGRCLGGYREVNIDADGKIYPCTLAVGNSEFCIGDIISGIDEVARENINKYSDSEIEECGNCGLNKVCDLRRCRIINYLETGSYCKVSPIMCAIERIRYEVIFKG